MKKNKKLGTLAASLVAGVALTGGLVACQSQQDSSQTTGQQVTEQYAPKLTNAEPYPLAQMSDSDERRNLRERLLRLNDPNKVGYITELTKSGTVFARYASKGKVSSTASQLTPTQNVTFDGGSGGGGNVAVESMGDDGSYGPEECGSQGIFFFDTQNVMHEWCGDWAWSDAPEKLSTPPIVTEDANATPTSNAGQRH